MIMNKHIIYLVLVVLLASCKSPSYLTRPADFKSHVHGLHVECDISDGGTLLGELIEVRGDSLTILVQDQYMDIPRSRVEGIEVIVAGVSNDYKKFERWGALLPISSITHGLAGVFTLPINLATGIAAATDARKGSYRMKYPKELPWDQLYKFSRFPQGMPPNFYDYE